MSTLEKRSRKSKKEHKPKKKRKGNDEKPVEVAADEVSEEVSGEVISEEEIEDEEPVWNISNMRKVRVSQFKGKIYVNIREYYNDKSTGEEKPGNKGIALNIDQWNALTEIIPKINKAVKKMQ